MEYRNEKHRIAFEDAIKKQNKRNYQLIATLYLLTADKQLWLSTKPFIQRNDIIFSGIRLAGCTENTYTLFCAAKDLYLEAKHLSTCDLADPTLISPKMFALICNAMAIRRFGLSAIERKERTAKA